MKKRRSRKQVWKYADGKLAAERQRIAESAAQWREEEERRVDAAYEAARRIADGRLAAVMDTAGTRYE